MSFPSLLGRRRRCCPAGADPSRLPRAGEVFSTPSGSPVRGRRVVAEPGAGAQNRTQSRPRRNSLAPPKGPRLARDQRGRRTGTRDIADQIDYSTGAVHTTLEDLAALAFVQRESDPGGSHRWHSAIGCVSGSGSSHRHSARSARRMPYISPVRCSKACSAPRAICAATARAHDASPPLRETVLVSAPETGYAKSSGGRIAYQVVGTGPPDVLVTNPAFLPVDLRGTSPGLFGSSMACRRSAATFGSTREEWGRPIRSRPSRAVC